MAVENKEEAELLSESDIAETTDSESIAPTDSSTSQVSSAAKPDSGNNKGAGGSKDSGRGKGGGGGGGGRDGKGSGKSPEKSPPVGIAEAIQFVKEVVIEFKKVSWPERSQIIKETWSVLFLVAVITVTVLAFDWALSHAIFMPLESWARLHGGGFGHGYQ